MSAVSAVSAVSAPSHWSQNSARKETHSNFTADVDDVDSIWKNLNVQFFQLMLSSPTVYQNPVNLTNFCQFCDFSKGSFGPLI